MGIIEVLELSENESTYGIEPNNPLISSSTPLKTLPQTITNISPSPDSTKTEIHQPVESEDILPLPLKELENLLKPVSPQITIIVTPPTPEKGSESAYTPEHNPFLLIPPDDSKKAQENKRPPDIRIKTNQITTIPNLNAASNSSILGGKSSTNLTPKLPRLRIKRILNRDTSAYSLIKPTDDDRANDSSNHHAEKPHNSSQLSFIQIENLNRTLQTKTAKLIEDNKMLENQLDQEKEKHRRELSKQEWKIKHAQLEIRMLKINIQEKEGKIKNQEAIILSSYTGYETDKNKPVKTADRTYRDLLRDNKRLENMLIATRKQMEEETTRKEMFKKEMLRIKEAADDETKKIIDDLTKKCNLLTVDQELATQKITDLKNHNKELAERIKEVTRSNSIAQSDITDAAP